MICMFQQLPYYWRHDRGPDLLISMGDIATSICSDVYATFDGEETFMLILIGCGSLIGYKDANGLLRTLVFKGLACL